MDLTLTRSTTDSRDLFFALREPKDVADLLEVSYRNLNYWIYATSEDKKYATFYIAKKVAATVKLTRQTKTSKSCNKN